MNVSSKGFLFRPLYPKNVSPFAPFLELPLLSYAYNLYFLFSSMRLCLRFLLPCAPSFHYASILIGCLLLSRVTVVNSPEEFLNCGKVISLDTCFWITSRVLLIYSYTNYISIYIWEYSTYVFCPPLIQHFQFHFQGTYLNCYLSLMTSVIILLRGGGCV